MADTKVTALAENTTPILTDIMYIVDDPGGSAASQKVTLTNIKAALGFPAFVGARYTSNAAQTITNGAAVAIIDFEDQVYDTGTLVTTGAAWKFTAPATGYYHIDCLISFATTTGWADGERGFLQLFKDGVAFANLDRKDNYATASNYMFLKGSITIALTATNYIDIRIAQNSGGNLALSNDPLSVWVNIERIG